MIINQSRLRFTKRYNCLASACFFWQELYLQNKMMGQAWFGLGPWVNRRNRCYAWAYYPVFSVFGPLGCCFVCSLFFLFLEIYNLFWVISYFSHLCRIFFKNMDVNNVLLLFRKSFMTQVNLLTIHKIQSFSLLNDLQV